MKSIEEIHGPRPDDTRFAIVTPTGTYRLYGTEMLEVLHNLVQGSGNEDFPSAKAVVEQILRDAWAHGWANIDY